MESATKERINFETKVRHPEPYFVMVWGWLMSGLVSSTSPGVIHPPNIATNNKLDEEKTAFQFILIFFNIFFPNKILLLLQSSIEQDFYQCGKFEILRGVLIGQLLSLEPSYWLNLGYWLRALSLLISSIYWALMWCVVSFVASNLSLPSLAAAMETISKLSSQHFQN